MHAGVIDRRKIGRAAIGRTPRPLPNELSLGLVDHSGWHPVPSGALLALAGAGHGVASAG
jgi:hypothetical protein